MILQSFPLIFWEKTAVSCLISTNSSFASTSTSLQSDCTAPPTYRWSLFLCSHQSGLALWICLDQQSPEMGMVNKFWSTSFKTPCSSGLCSLGRLLSDPLGENLLRMREAQVLNCPIPIYPQLNTTHERSKVLRTSKTHRILRTANSCFEGWFVHNQK